MRAVVVGAGNISRVWFEALKAEGVEVTAVVDLNLEAARARIAEFKLAAQAGTDLAAALERHRPDFVIDLTIPEARYAVVAQCLTAGYHVVSEKPMAATLQEARELLALAEDCGRLYMVSQNRRWDVNHATIRKLVASGAIGTLNTVTCDFFIGPHFGGFRERMASPLLHDMAIHHFDLARYMTGCDALAVYAREYNPPGSWYAGAAAAQCLFELQEGVIFSYRGSWCAEGFPTSWNGHWRFVGDKGTLTYEHDALPQVQVVTGSEGFFRSVEDLDVTPSPVPATGQQGALREMLEFLRSDKLPQTEAGDNIKSLKMVFAAIHSSQKGTRISLETA